MAGAIVMDDAMVSRSTRRSSASLRCQNKQAFDAIDALRARVQQTGPSAAIELIVVDERGVQAERLAHTESASRGRGQCGSLYVERPTLPWACVRKGGAAAFSTDLCLHKWDLFSSA